MKEAFFFLFVVVTGPLCFEYCQCVVDHYWGQSLSFGLNHQAWWPEQVFSLFLFLKLASKLSEFYKNEISGGSCKKLLLSNPLVFSCGLFGHANGCNDPSKNFPMSLKLPKKLRIEVSSHFKTNPYKS